MPALHIFPPPHHHDIRSERVASTRELFTTWEILITSFVQFLQRSRTLAFYRTILRGIKRIQDPTTKAESKKYARDEFERHRNVTDLVRSSFPLIPFSITAFDLYISENPGDPSANTQAAVPYQIPIINRQDRVGDNGALYRPHVKEKKNLREEENTISIIFEFGFVDNTVKQDGTRSHLRFSPYTASKRRPLVEYSRHHLAQQNRAERFPQTRTPIGAQVYSVSMMWKTWSSRVKKKSASYRIVQCSLFPLPSGPSPDLGVSLDRISSLYPCLCLCLGFDLQIM
jgi:hypothetical protein